MNVDKSFDADVAKPKNIAIIHPDLGIGGAERLIVDVAIGLQDLKNHYITIYTSHCDKSHAFEEVANDKLDVVVYGDFLPRKIFGRFTILCATLRQLYLTMKVLFLTGSSYDFYIIDSLAACLPVIWLFNILLKSKNGFSKVLFYCHFPDLKLSQNSTGSTLKSLYRMPFDYYEQFCYVFPHKLYVNSNFTKQIFAETFDMLPGLASFTAPTVAYPCIDETIHNDPKLDAKIHAKFSNSKFFLSINRFERKKNVELAIKSFSELVKREKTPSKSLKLLVAGGYDKLVLENVEYLKDLCTISADFNLQYRVFTDYQEFIDTDLTAECQIYFLPNVSTDLRNSLMKYTAMLLYTPSFEHFGIVPIEAMKYNTLVLAINNGGPKESIAPLDDDYEGLKTEKISITNDKGTGFLKPADEKIWSNVMECIISMNDSQRAKLGSNGEKIIEKLFTRKVLTETINEDIVRLSKNLTNLEFQETQRTLYFFLVALGAPFIAITIFLLYLL